MPLHFIDHEQELCRVAHLLREGREEAFLADVIAALALDRFD